MLHKDPNTIVCYNSSMLVLRGPNIQGELLLTMKQMIPAHSRVFMLITNIHV